MGFRIGGVAVLVEEGDTVHLLGQPLGHAHGTVGALRARRADDLGAHDLEQLAALG